MHKRINMRTQLYTGGRTRCACAEHALRTGLRMTDHWDVIGFGGTARNVPLAISLARTESIAAPTQQPTQQTLRGGIVGNSYARLWIVRVDEPHHVLRRLLEPHEQLSEGRQQQVGTNQWIRSDRQTN